MAPRTPFSAPARPAPCPAPSLAPASPSAEDRRTARRAYKETVRPAGVYAIRRHADGRVWLGASTDLPSALRRQRFTLDAGGHPHHALQADWRRDGPDGFAVEVLDTLTPDPARPAAASRAQVDALRALWSEELDRLGTARY